MPQKTDPPPDCSEKKPPKPEGRILIVDDDYSLRSVLHTALFSAGYDVGEAASGEEAFALARVVRYDVGEAASGEEAFALARVVRYDVVLLSLRIPGKSGIEICRELRRRFPRLAIVILTVSETEDEKIEALDSGADDYMTKPFQMRELLARVRAAIRRMRTPQDAERSTHPGWRNRVTTNQSPGL